MRVLALSTLFFPVSEEDICELRVIAGITEGATF